MTRTLDVDVTKGKIEVALTNNESGNITEVVKGLSEIKLREYYQAKIAESPAEIFPPAIRWMSSDRTRLIWERPPGYHTINYSATKQDNLGASEASRMMVRIPVPWQVYFICFNEDFVANTIYMFFRREPLGFGDNSVGYAPLSNFYKDARLCQAVYDQIPDANNLYDMLDNVYNMIWNSGFNEDLHECIDIAYQLNKAKGHPIFTEFNSSQRSKYYTRWSQIDLDTMAQASWPTAYNDVIKLAEDYTPASNQIRLVQFVMDIQSV